jgi:Protein of unknown function (DUF1501)
MAMLTWLGKPFVERRRLTRRALLHAGVVGLTGLTLPRLLAAESTTRVRRRARSCIYILLNGGPSQLDTFDLKPDAPIRPDDLAATLYECPGIPADTMLVDSRQRPHRISEGTPVRALLA